MAAIGRASGRWRESEAARAQSAARRFDELGRRLAGRAHGRKLGQDRRGERRERIDHRRDEHVAADAADEIEVDRERGRRRQRLRQPTTGTT